MSEFTNESTLKNGNLCPLCSDFKRRKILNSNTVTSVTLGIMQVWNPSKSWF